MSRLSLSPALSHNDHNSCRACCQNRGHRDRDPDPNRSVISRLCSADRIFHCCSGLLRAVSSLAAVGLRITVLLSAARPICFAARLISARRRLFAFFCRKDLGAVTDSQAVTLRIVRYKSHCADICALFYKFFQSL